MRPWLPMLLLFTSTLALLSAGTPPVAAQVKSGEEESIITADGFRLRGLFHQSTKGAAGSAPVVILLYAPGADQDMNKGEWGVLIKQLTESGFHVLQFDWRGHGKSKDIADTAKFWNLDGTNAFTGEINKRYIKDAPPKKPIKDEFVFKDFRPGNFAANYLPVYVNDLAAVRLHLDKKNDNAKANTTSVYLIGVGDAAAIGMAWIYAEWNRPAVRQKILTPVGTEAPYDFVPRIPVVRADQSAGTDIAAAIWISPTIPTRIPRTVMQRWVTQQPNKLRSTPMMFLVSEKDDAGKRDAEVLFKDVLVARPPKGSTLSEADKTFLIDIKGADKTQRGLQLLGKADLKVEELIVKYMVEQIQKKRPTEESVKRDYKDPYFIDLSNRLLGILPP